jgi:hypothetical protein
MNETKLRAVSAGTKHPNTKETDQMSHVLHVVELSDGREIETMATDPMDAIAVVDRRIQEGSIT